MVQKSTAMDARQILKDYIVNSILFGDGERLQAEESLRESRILDSLGFLDIITFIERQFDIEIADDEVIPENFDSLIKMSEFVERKRNGRTAAP